MHLNELVKYISILIYLLFITGCSQPILRMGVDGLSNNEISIIKTQNKNISIITVDGQRSVGLLTYMFSDWAGEARIKPGNHQLKIAYKKGQVISQYIYDLKTESGHTYLLKSHAGNLNASVWFEDIATGALVGNIIESSNEPITNKNKTLKNSNYYTFISPQKDNWTIAYRNQAQTHLAKNGNSLNETYAISIFPIQIPNFLTKQDFIEYIQQENKKGINPKRFNVTKFKVKPYNKRTDYCINYHSIAEDKKPVTKTHINKMMTLEIAGFICRHPDNKNIAINYGYSQRYYQGNQDKDLIDKSVKIFEQIKF